MRELLLNSPMELEIVLFSIRALFQIRKHLDVSVTSTIVTNDKSVRFEKLR